MSYHTWHEYGLGVCVTKLEFRSTERIEKLLEMAPELREKIHEWFSDCEIDPTEVSSYIEYDQDWYLGMATILREAIWEAEGIEFTACDDFDCRQYLIYQPKYPWHMTDKDMEMTAEKVEEILHKYLSIVTDSEIIVEDQEVANGG